jgi:TatD DNase family protein
VLGADSASALGRTEVPDDVEEPLDPPRSSGAVDSHCHLYLMEVEPAEAVAAANAAGVERMVCVGIDPETSARSLELAESFRGVFATAGMHPNEASGFDRAASASIEQLLASPLVVGVGETGLDYYRRGAPVDVQHRVFRDHIALARESGLPLVVHVRDAWDDALRILDEQRAERVVLHCFTGDAAIAREAGARGYFVSFAGNVTYPKAEGMREAAGAVGEDRLLLETDSPFLPPQRRRGQPNTPAGVFAVAEALSAVRGVEAGHIMGRTARNAAAAFPFGA